MDLSRVVRLINAKGFRCDSLMANGSVKAILENHSIGDLRLRYHVSLASLPGAEADHWNGSVTRVAIVQTVPSEHGVNKLHRAVVWKTRAKGREGQLAMNIVGENNVGAWDSYPSSNTLYFDGTESVAAYIRLRGWA